MISALYSWRVLLIIFILIVIIITVDSLESNHAIYEGKATQTLLHAEITKLIIMYTYR